MKYLELSMLVIIGMFIGAGIVTSANNKREVLTYEQGFEDGYRESLYFLRDFAKKTVSDTNHVYCADFYVNKDTIHMEAWSKAIKVKMKKEDE